MTKQEVVDLERSLYNKLDNAFRVNYSELYVQFVIKNKWVLWDILEKYRKDSQKLHDIGKVA